MPLKRVAPGLNRYRYSKESSDVQRSRRGHSRQLFATILMTAFATSALAAGPEWTLPRAIERVMEVAPEKGAAEARVEASRGALEQARLWPNPTIELGAGNAMGKEDGQGGTDFNLIGITQPLPLGGRLEARRKAADARYRAALAGAGERALELELETARRFHRLQLDGARLELARQRLESAEGFSHIARRREAAGDLSRLERLRLDLVSEGARQLVATAEGRHSEALNDFRTLLALPGGEPELPPLNDFPALAPLAELERILSGHPALAAARRNEEAARLAIDQIRAERISDPELWITRERDVLGGRRQNALSFGLSVTVPLWDRAQGSLDAARAAHRQARLEREALERQLSNRLRLSHLHLAHLIEQGREYRAKVLEPAEEIFRLTRSGFAAGQVGILGLVDAVETYFEARQRYLELMEQSWMEAAVLRHAAGISLLAAAP